VPTIGWATDISGSTGTRHIPKPNMSYVSLCEMDVSDIDCVMMKCSPKGSAVLYVAKHKQQALYPQPTGTPHTLR
jgi:hypothetical protein